MTNMSGFGALYAGTIYGVVTALPLQWFLHSCAAVIRVVV